MKYILTIATIISLSTSTSNAQQVVKSFFPDRDNTIYNEGDLSNGQGVYLFSGVTKEGAIRRALVHFDLASVPAGTAIDSAVLTLTVSKSIAGGMMTWLHRMNADWGEGDSDADGQEGKGDEAFPGDATWTYSFFDNTAWEQPGGDYNETASDSTSAGNSGKIEFRGTSVTNEVLEWIQQPAENFGWILITDESSNPSAKRFYSRNWEDNPADRPVLRIYYEGTTGLQADRNSNKDFESYYNPGSRMLGVRLPDDFQTGDCNVGVYAVTGCKVLEQSTFLAPGRNSILLQTDLARGIYIARIKAGSRDYISKFIVIQ